MPAPPTGTVTFLFTDIEGSTKRWEKHPAAMAGAVEKHDALLREIIEKHDGYVFKTIGDAFCAAFPSPASGIRSALEAQHAILAQEWDEVAPIKVRMALHTGEAQERDNDYFGPTVNRVARILGTGHGGQTLLSQMTWQSLQGLEITDVEFRDFGSHRLKDLAQAEQIFGLLAPGLEAGFPPLASLNRQTHNLPVHPTPLIGRDAEVAEVLELLRADTVRLVTLSGPGGTGKTRLSLQIAADALDGFPDGAFFVSLAHAGSTEDVVVEIRQALGLRETADESLQSGLVEHLKSRKCLLLLDNFEQVTSASGLVADLLASCPGLKLLVTSQSILRLRGEREFPVSPLGLPPKRLPPLSQVARFPAVELFVSRAQAARPNFELTAENVAAVVEICRRLDGLPLALELAAARSKLLTPQAMLGHLKNRLKLLTGGARDLPARQRTLRDAIAWSHDLLDDSEKVLLRRLAVFQGGFTLEAALTVAELPAGEETDVFNGLETLADKSLIRQQEAGDEIRFSMLENIREFGLEKLAESGEAEAIQAQHAQYFGTWMEALAQAVQNDPSLDLQACEFEHDNLRAALEWRFQADDGKPGELAVALAPYWERQGHFREAREVFTRCLSNSEAIDPGTKARLVELSGWFRYLVGDFVAARAFMEENLEWGLSHGEMGVAADALNDLGLLARDEGDSETSRRRFEESLALVRETGDRPRQATRLMNLAIPAMDEGRLEDAHILLTEANTIFAGLGDRSGQAACLCNLGKLDLERQDYPSARLLSEKSLALFRELSDQRGIVFALANIAEVFKGGGDFIGAIPFLEEAFAIAGEVGLHPLLPLLLEDLSKGYRAQDSVRSAYAAITAASILRERLDLARLETEVGEWASFEANLVERLGTASEQIRDTLTQLETEAIIVQVAHLRSETS